MTERDTVSEPPNAFLNGSRPTFASDRFDNGEPLELHEIRTHEDEQLDLSDPSASSGDEYVVPRRTPSRSSRGSRASRESRHRKGLWGQIYRFWTRHVMLTVPQKSNRDHFGMSVPVSEHSLHLY